jgi:hypothetical protein
LAQERAKNAELQKQLEELSNAIPSDRPSDKIPRPAGTAGNDFNIQNEMGLGGSQANREIYKALMVREVSDSSVTYIDVLLA